MIRIILILFCLLIGIIMCDSLNNFGNGISNIINGANTPCPKLGPPTLTSEVQTIDLCMG